MNAPSNKPQLSHIPISEIEIGERFRKDYGDITQLIHSIKKNGLITPVAVCLSSNLKDSKTEKPYTLAAGGRRMTAILEMGWPSVPCRVYDQPLSELDFRSIELAENLDRKEMSHVEEVALKMQIHKLQMDIHGPKISNMPEAPGWSAADTARMLGESAANLSRDLKLANAINLFPELGLDKTKNKSDALKLLNTVGKKIDQGMKADSYVKEMGSTNITFKRLSESYIIGDCFETLSKIPANSLDFIEIDPPYAMDLHSKKSDAVMIGYNEVEADDYPRMMQTLFAECHRVLRNDSWMVCWFAQDPWFHWISQWLEAAGFKFSLLTGLWTKPNGQTMQPETFFSNCYEPFFYCRKGQPKLNKPGRSNIFSFAPVPPAQKYHPTQRPLDLMVELYNTFCGPGKTCYIPFLGSGVGLIAAHQCKMTAFGTDLTKEFKEGYIVKLKGMLEVMG